MEQLFLLTLLILMLKKVENITSRIIKTRSYFARWVENFDKSKQKKFWYVICINSII